MDYINKKLVTLSGEALSNISGLHKKTQPDSGTPAGQQQLDNNTQDFPPSITDIIDTQLQTTRTHGQHVTQATVASRPLAGGVPFGGDSFSGYQRHQPPPPGFRSDLFGGGRYTSNTLTGQSTSSAATAAVQPAPSRLDSRADHLRGSEESLHDGDAWTRLWFQRVMILSLIRLLLFIRKLYEDFQATKTYNLTGQTGHFLVSAATLFLPTIVFTIYRVARYLQVALPPIRAIKQLQQLQKQATTSKGGDDHQTTRSAEDKASGQPKRPPRRNSKSDEDAQMTRALMTSPTTSMQTSQRMDSPSSIPSSPVQNIEDDGLVTARQTPTVQLEAEQFHDTQQEAVVVMVEPSRGVGGSSRLDLTSEKRVKLESVDVDKLGDIPDKETTRVVIGSSEQLLHGALFVFWQLKRQVDVMGYLVERACLWRRPSSQEKEELERMRTGSDGLEWFQDFYAAFLAILAQVYTLGLHWSSGENNIRATSVNAATSALGSSTLVGGSGDSLSISHSARTLSDALSSKALTGDLGAKDLLIMSELVVSSAVVMSLLIAVRRKDDGPLTLGLSILGWGSLFSARIIVIALAFVHIGWKIMLPLVIIHVLSITGWIYKIALDSHNDKPSERELEAKWDPELAAEDEPDDGQEEVGAGATAAAIELKKSQTVLDQTTNAVQGDDSGLELRNSPAEKRVEPMELEVSPVDDVGPNGTMATSSWSAVEHVTLLAQILTLFAIPSIFYWPIMFNLKLHLRPFKYLVLIMIQNFILIPAIWFSIEQANATAGQLYLLGAIGAFSIAGFVFVSLYVACKPSLTEYFARADELFNEAEKSGIYYEFCSRVFKMPDLSKHSFRRLMDQTETIIEEQYIEEAN